jgi:hypothetical protein
MHIRSAGDVPAPSSEVQMKALMTAAMLSATAFSPASAAMMTCTSDNMAKSTATMMNMPDTPAKRAADKEMGMANAEMSKGNMKGACKHYMMAQQAASAK